MVYENGHKKVLGIWLDLVLKVKYSKILIFKAIFLCQKSAESLQKKISLKNTKMGDKLSLIPYFDNFDFQCTLFPKNAPNWRTIPNQAKLQEYFYGWLKYYLVEGRTYCRTEFLADFLTKVRKEELSSIYLD